MEEAAMTAQHRSHIVTDRKRGSAEQSGSPPTDVELRGQLLADVPVKERHLRLAGLSTAVLEGGSGPPMVLLHGPGEHAPKWIRVIPYLVASHHVVAPDLPGHGASEMTHGPLDAGRVLDWLGELIARTCPEPPILVGQILGGAIAARFALEHGERVSHLVLVDALGLAPFQPTPEFASALTDFIAQPTEVSHERLWRRCAYDFDALRARMGGSWSTFAAYNLDRAQVPGVQAAQQCLMTQFGMPAIPPDELERIEVPTSLIWGRHDLATQLSVAQAASARYGWPLHVVENAADDPPLEQPEAFVKALHAALGEPRRRARQGHASPTTADQSGGTVEEVREAWSRIAEGYDAFVTPTHRWLANEGLRRAGLRPDMRFLDVAAGTGALSIPAARLGARVLATDISPTMLERLRARAAGEGLSPETRVMDGQALDLEDGTFDVCGSQFGVMLFPDMPRGVSEMARVTKAGGTVLMNVFGAPDKVEFLDFFLRAVQAAVPGFTGPRMDPPPLPFQLRDPDRLRRVMAEAGLRKVRVETVTERLEFRTGQQLWNWLTNSNPIVGALLSELSLTGEQHAAVQRTLDDMVRRRSGGHGPAVLTNPVHIGVGTR
jgi:pimeloyl-ACP methyl ester carboxylesterase/ubiquinone/menaquinone biosynthesis C-methylase UbiE